MSLPADRRHSPLYLLIVQVAANETKEIALLAISGLEPFSFPKGGWVRIESSQMRAGGPFSIDKKNCLRVSRVHAVWKLRDLCARAPHGAILAYWQWHDIPM